MWKRVTIIDGRQYTVQLCQRPDGHRFCAVAEAGTIVDDMILRTDSIPASVIRDASPKQIAGLGLLGGGRFFFGPHGEWFTEAEMEALEDDHEIVPWVTHQPPNLAPK